MLTIYLSAKIVSNRTKHFKGSVGKVDCLKRENNARLTRPRTGESPCWDPACHEQCSKHWLIWNLFLLCWNDDYTIAQWLEHRWRQLTSEGPWFESLWWQSMFSSDFFGLSLSLKSVYIILYSREFLTGSDELTVPKGKEHHRTERKGYTLKIEVVQNYSPAHRVLVSELSCNTRRVMLRSMIL